MNFYGLSSKRRRGNPYEPLTWTQRTPDMGTTEVESVWYDGSSTWCAGGGYNAGFKTTVASDPTSTWTVSTVGGVNEFCNGGMCYDGTYWVTTAITSGDNGIWTAPDPAATWTHRGINSISFAEVFYDGSTNWVAAGVTGILHTATDPTGSWVSRTSGFGADRIYDVWYGNGVWVTVGENSKLFTATDPTSTWTSRANPFTGTITGVAYGNGIWTAVGYAGEMATAVDPTSTWTSRTSGFGATNIQCVAYGNGAWVAAGNSGTMTTATDPTDTWNIRTSSFGATLIKDVHYGSDGNWVAGGSTGKLATAVPGV